MSDYEIPRELALIINLRNATIYHKRYCKTNCNVSLSMLRDAARYIRNCMVLNQALEAEVNAANENISDMSIIH